ncbi:MAG: hypothetical protein K9N35_06170 [Candidatus Marinimicrobia bacterium]|nr:hypothetical protein [Candidatus Neomarinimicrobiota bacterium]
MKILIPILFLFLVACPDPPEETICGQGMILSGDTCTCVPNAHPSDDGSSCECDSLYHWDEDLYECVLDTTSYDITWEFDTLGIYWSTIHDVAIVSQDDIWAVGWITFPDPDSSSDGTGEESFNAAHWNGSEWEFLHLGAMSGTGTIGTHTEIFSVFNVDNDNLWMFTSGGSYIHFDGTDWSTDIVPERIGQVHEIWGNHSDNLYFVGSNGTITHYDGSSFTLIESNTDIRLYDVRGSEDGQYVVTVGIGDFGITKVIQLVDNQAILLFDNDSIDYSELSGFKAVDVWGHTAYIATFYGLLTYDFETGDTTWVNLNDLLHDFLYIWRIEVNAPNDIFIAGDGGRMMHYNGYRWIKDFRIRSSFQIDGHIPGIGGIDYKDGMIVSAGTVGGVHAYIARGYRN